MNEIFQEKPEDVIKQKKRAGDREEREIDPELQLPEITPAEQKPEIGIIEGGLREIRKQEEHNKKNRDKKLPEEITYL